MPIRRAADPINVKRIWDAIRYTSLQHQLVDAGKIIKYLQKINNCSQAQAELYIKQTLKDGLIVASSSRPLQKTNDPLQTYKITTQELPELDGKDWYCFECHLAGEVTVCLNCFRVFHSDCIPNGKRKFEAQRKAILNQNSQQTKSVGDTSGGHNLEEAGTNNYNSIKNYIYDESLCSMCNVGNIDTEYDLDKSEMNYLLKFVLHRIRSWLPTILTHTMAQEDKPEWLTDQELTWRSNQLFFEHKDMSVIEVNLNNEHYSQLSEFLGDVLTVQHNVAVFHGMESQEYGAAELMVRDTIYDMTELRNCSDCYRHSNEKMNMKWFCLPCRIPHKLVWAKQKGYPYWPAKVIKETSTHFDVRFFGGKYERALLVRTLIKPISVSRESLQIKNTSGFTKAYEELQLHQRLLNNPAELEQFLASSKQKKRLFAKPKIPTLSPMRKSPAAKRMENTGNSLPTNEIGTDITDLTKRKYSANKSTEEPEEKKMKPNSGEQATTSGNVIDISDGDEIEEESSQFSFIDNSYPPLVYDCGDETYEQVTSSTENYRVPDGDSPPRENGMQQLDHPYSDSVEKMRRKLECLTEKKSFIQCAMDCMQKEIDKMGNDHNEHLKRLFESHNAQISEIKKKQWCFNCEQDAIYHCCWNTAYCSQTCQQQHWQAEHKKVCRRKR